MSGLLRGTFVLWVLMNAGGLLAQRVTNVTAEQQGQDLVISYALETDGPVEVDLYVSIDQGKNWQGPLSNCSGDVGKNVLAGASKRIRWPALEERELVGDGIRFKVVARPATMTRAELAKRPWLNPKLEYGSVTDIDGNIYATIQIGKQVWMAENLRATRYRNGDRILTISDTASRQKIATGVWIHYKNEYQFDDPYGKLYNWYAIADPRGLCPTGWHVPSDAEWTVLTVHLGGDAGAGGQLKATSLWKSPNTGATNDSGFSGIPGGFLLNTGDKRGFCNYLYSGLWWSATEYQANNAWYRYLEWDNDVVGRLNYDKHNNFSVRCILD